MTATASPTLAREGMVEVALAVPVPSVQVWQALTEPTQVARWFGDLAEPLVTGRPNRLDFGDGDFFTLQEVSIQPPHRLSYAWRFLGIGPLDTITWDVSPSKAGALVCVTDSQPGRSAEAARLLRQGWLDFVQRLERMLVHHAGARYDWRREFDGSIELSCSPALAWDRLLDNHTVGGWLPVEPATLSEGTTFVVGLDGEPARLEVASVRWTPRARVQVVLTHSSWAHPTECELEIGPRPGGALLSVAHHGWESISSDPDVQLSQRKRFCEFWIDRLQQAPAIAERSSVTRR